jgi:hypothetical protein
VNEITVIIALTSAFAAGFISGFGFRALLSKGRRLQH